MPTCSTSRCSAPTPTATSSRAQRLPAARDDGPDGLPNTDDDVLVEGNPAAPIDSGRAHRPAVPRRHRPSAIRPPTPTAPAAHGRSTPMAAMDDGRNHLRRRAARRALHRRRRARQREHRAHRRPPHLPLGAQPAGRAIQGGADAATTFLNQWLIGRPAARFLAPGRLSSPGVERRAPVPGREASRPRCSTSTSCSRSSRARCSPTIDEFLRRSATTPPLNPAIVAEFAHVVYRFGHSMLTETVDRSTSTSTSWAPQRLDPAGQQMGLIAAFLNPLAFTQDGIDPPKRRPAPSCAA